MKIVEGIFAEAKIFTDDVEKYAEAQVKLICDNETAEGIIICMMPCVKLNRTNAEFQKLDRVIWENMPSGFAVRRDPHDMAGEFSYKGLHRAYHINRSRAERSLGTLGGGNHFIELDRGSDDRMYLVVHTGSRHLGEKTEKYYTELANGRLKEQGREISYLYELSGRQ